MSQLHPQQPQLDQALVPPSVQASDPTTNTPVTEATEHQAFVSTSLPDALNKTQENKAEENKTQDSKTQDDKAEDQGAQNQAQNLASNPQQASEHKDGSSEQKHSEQQAIPADKPIEATSLPDVPVAIITGASSGIGEQATILLLQQGYRVYAAARRVERMQELAKAGAQVQHLDIQDEASVDALVQRVIAETGRIDVLVNNAGFGLLGAVEDVSLSEARRQFEVNLFGLGYLTQKCLPHMRARNYGRIINVSSIAGRVHTPLMAWYVASKHALCGWSDCLRMEVEEFGIEVTVIEPSATESEWGAIAADSLEANLEKTAYKSLTQRIVNSLRRAYAPGAKITPAATIARQILAAATAEKPKTNYLHPMGMILLASKLLLPTRWYNKLMRKYF